MQNGNDGNYIFVNLLPAISVAVENRTQYLAMRKQAAIDDSDIECIARKTRLPVLQ